MVNLLTAEQRAINAEGIALCRATIEPYLVARETPEPAAPPTEVEEIHQRALERAIGERRNRILDRIGAIA